ncbi:uncharacterized protein BCR38DRAFT_155266 [Pseudomassariella vexata]|uniref:Uncharacterized protein n=1 Tax=Pseudomassariella vexata TaxID=1141098 RepID=A0A1Y2E8Z2_9PEZI|nr:uncharacterized protein BCR38DRAFT_155266 [Pseudomassariella vexata]ORY67335.1 hypothetical protein BCR38DRAFT_155266 [Pseudomassariella vexata]
MTFVGLLGLSIKHPAMASLPTLIAFQPPYLKALSPRTTFALISGLSQTLGLLASRLSALIWAVPGPIFYAALQQGLSRW